MGSLFGLQQDFFGQLANKLERFRDLTQKVIHQFQDPRKTTFVAVCIPEFLPIYETERLLQDLKKFQIDCKYIIVNHVINESIQLGMNPEDLFHSRVKVQNKYIEKVRDLYSADFHVTKLPLLPYEVRGLATISTFAKLLLGTNNPFYKEFLKKESHSLDIEEYPPTLQNVLDEDSLRWIFIGGKGGVGKTSVSSALATLLSERTEGRVLLVSTDPAHNLSDAFNQSFSSSPTAVEGNTRLDVMEVSPNVEELFTQDQDGGLPFDIPGFGDFGNIRSRIRDIFSDMISSIPGIDEAISFGHIVRFIRNQDYKVVVFDTAPTGHTLRLLSFPSVLENGVSWLSSFQEQYLPLLQSAAAMMQNSNATGNQSFSPRDIENLMKQKLRELKATIETVQEQFRDPSCTTFICVTIAEALSIYETERLVQQLASYDMDCRNIVVNQLFDPNEEHKKEMLLLRAKMQQKYLDQVDELYSSDSFVIKAPLLPEELYGLEHLKMFANYLKLP
ncbi:ATPase GET3 [Galdieria sulphuraria]|nr:ATPase GET3 [Galdieria sulphuraria]